ncbi:MAG TPA: DUF6531 domain-containing protein [Thiobacillus sp.]|nr:DUF6531 domain-containing protein [Thiobacillus sp.]
MSSGMRSCAQGARGNDQLVTPLEKNNKWSLTPFISFISLFLLFISLYSISNTAYANYPATKFYMTYHNGGENPSDYEYFLSASEALIRKVEIINSELPDHTAVDITYCRAQTDWRLVYINAESPYSQYVSAHVEAYTIPCQGTNWQAVQIGSGIQIDKRYKCSYEVIYSLHEHTCYGRPPAPKSHGGDCDASTPHPIKISTGNKWLLEPDYDSKFGNFAFNRYYNSQLTYGNANIGLAWGHSFHRKITTDSSGNFVTVLRPDGKHYIFNKNTDGWIPEGDIVDRLVELKDNAGLRTGWIYIDSNGERETYSATGQIDGKLLTLTDRTGLTQTLSYSCNEVSASCPVVTPSTTAPISGLLIKVTDSLGSQLNFTYNTRGNISTMADPSGGLYIYAYDSNNNLASVTYPDNKVRAYHYENVTFPNALSGITDENGNRFVTYDYDLNGLAISEQLAGGVEQYSLVFNNDASGNPSSTTVTDPLGTARTHSFTTILGVVKSTGQSQPGGSGCGPASSATTYDANGNVASRADFNGIKTCYAWDLTRNLETARVEGLASGTACPGNLASYIPAANTVERKTLTQWHPSFRLPVSITEAGRETSTVYDSRGNVTSTSIKDTVLNRTRTWTTAYSYHPSVPGVLAQKIEDGPRIDVADISTTDYYLPTENCLGGHYGCRGQVRQINNALGHVTRITRYSAHGQPEEIVDPNGLVTALAYDARQRLIQRSVGSEFTQYDYDGVGQLKQVVLPSGAVARYDYDAAHGLTDIWDEDNNHILYTLDVMGNRVQEDVYAAAGNPVATRNRSFDALNRLWQDIGAVNAATGNRPVTTYGYDANGNLKTVQPPRPARDELPVRRAQPSVPEHRCPRRRQPDPLRPAGPAAGSARPAQRDHGLSGQRLRRTDPGRQPG